MKENFAQLLNFNKNLLISGVAKSGRKQMAKKIIEEFEKVSFNELEKQNRVTTITFHPGYSYEHFVEKINQADPQIIENGILKKVANRASLELLKTEMKNSLKKIINIESKIWKVSLGYRKTEERMYRLCKKAGIIALGWLEKESLEGKAFSEIYTMLLEKRGNDEPKLSSDTSSVNILVNELRKGDFILIYNEKNQLTDIGLVDSEYFHLNDYLIPYPHRRKVKWLKNLRKPLNMENYDRKTRFSLETIYELTDLDFGTLREIIGTKQNFEKKEILNHYLLINEIDRGQINEIFGETISILAKEERNISQTILSKSGRKFSLPENLFLIATMGLSGQEKLLSDPILNSVFSIIELQPETKLLEKLKLVKKEQEFSPVNLEELLQTINTKITDLAGREKLIGHGYFLDLKTLEEFYQLWYFRLLPRLKSNWGGNPEQLFFIAGKKFFNPDLSLNFLNYRTPGLSEFEVAIKEISNLSGQKKI